MGAASADPFYFVLPRVLVFLLVSFGLIGLSRAEIVVRDDAGELIRLPAPARRIVCLTPHVTENVFAAGAGASVVAAVDYSDYPVAARQLPRVGNAGRVDLEAVLALKPDLVVAGNSAGTSADVAKLKQMGVPVYVSAPSRLDDIPQTLEELGQLAGRPIAGKTAADGFRLRLKTLTQTHAQRPKVRLFYQIWDRPLLTLGGREIQNAVFGLCGGENVFASLRAPAPSVSVEAVLAANPEVILASRMGSASDDGLANWMRWPRIQAVARGNLFELDADLLQRATPRLLDGADVLCTQLEIARKRR